MSLLPRNHVYQYSIINALMAGVSESGIPVSSLLAKGTHGLGTFVRMDGEMVLLDGHCYQLQAGGRIREAHPTDECPYACVSHFAADETQTRVALPNRAALDRLLDDWARSRGAENLFLAYRVAGRFRKVRCRTVRGQTYAGQPLAELGDNQCVDEYRDVRGTIVGFRAPRLWQGLFVAGEHMHFVDEERKRGGHVLGVEAGEETGTQAGEGSSSEPHTGVEVQLAVVADLHLELPRSRAFNEATLETDDEGVKAVEG